MVVRGAELQGDGWQVGRGGGRLVCVCFWESPNPSFLFNGSRVSTRFDCIDDMGRMVLSVDGKHWKHWKHWTEWMRPRLTWMIHSTSTSVLDKQRVDKQAHRTRFMLYITHPFTKYSPETASMNGWLAWGGAGVYRTSSNQPTNHNHAVCGDTLGDSSRIHSCAFMPAILVTPAIPWNAIQESAVPHHSSVHLLLNLISAPPQPH